MLSFLYETLPGRLLLRPLVSRGVSDFVGAVLEHPASKCCIQPFVRSHAMDLSDYDLSAVDSFADFFARPLKPGRRVVCTDPHMLPAPCDGLLSVYLITQGTVLPVKQASYTLRALLRSEKLARHFEGGTAFVFRLCVDHYHRYIYPLDAYQSAEYRVPGVYHTVRPVALRQRPVFCENSRAYTVLTTPQAGLVVQMEVGAMLVGRICNTYTQPRAVYRGQEKGYFQYGGSTILLLTQAHRVRPLWAPGPERPVRLGQPVAQLL